MAQDTSLNLNTPIDTGPVTVGATITPLTSVSLTDRKRYKGFFVQPNGGDIRIGGLAVTTASGILVTDGTTLFVDWSFGNNWCAVRNAGVDVTTIVLPVR